MGRKGEKQAAPTWKLKTNGWRRNNQVNLINIDIRRAIGQHQKAGHLVFESRGLIVSGPNCPKSNCTLWEGGRRIYKALQSQVGEGKGNRYSLFQITFVPLLQQISKPSWHLTRRIACTQMQPVWPKMGRYLSQAGRHCSGHARQQLVRPPTLFFSGAGFNFAASQWATYTQPLTEARLPFTTHSLSARCTNISCGSREGQKAKSCPIYCCQCVIPYWILFASNTYL